jgi:glutamate/tyrosine decarboxylase-like PLP-dependent enzyme
MLPWIERLGYPVPPWDFRVPGVTSISADIHKYGWGVKGSSVILFRNAELRSHLIFAYAEWPGGACRCRARVGWPWWPCTHTRARVWRVGGGGEGRCAGQLFSLVV